MSGLVNTLRKLENTFHKFEEKFDKSALQLCMHHPYLFFMATLRKKIEKSPNSPQYIQTHVGVGYRMIKVE